MVRSRNRGQGGFTLVELLTVMALALIGLAGFLAGQLVAVRTAALARALGEATVLAQDKMEALQATPLPLLAPSVEQGLDATGQAAATGRYTRIVTLSTTGSLVSTTVTVRFTGQDDRPHSVTVSTVRSP